LKEPRVWAGGTAAKPLTVPAIEPVRVHHLLINEWTDLRLSLRATRPTRSIASRATTSGSRPVPDVAQGRYTTGARVPGLPAPGALELSVSVDVLGRLIEIWSGPELRVVPTRAGPRALGHDRHRLVLARREMGPAWAMSLRAHGGGLLPVRRSSPRARRTRRVFTRWWGLVLRARVDYPTIHDHAAPGGGDGRRSGCSRVARSS